MPVKRTTLELDETLTERALAATGGTLRATVEKGLRLVISQGADDEARRRERLDRHVANASSSVDFDVVLSGEAWR